MRKTLTLIDRSLARHLDREAPIRDALWILVTWCVVIACALAAYAQ